jgi:hypothetical protein
MAYKLLNIFNIDLYKANATDSVSRRNSRLQLNIIS